MKYLQANHDPSLPVSGSQALTWWVTVTLIGGSFGFAVYGTLTNVAFSLYYSSAGVEQHFVGQHFLLRGVFPCVWSSSLSVLITLFVAKLIAGLIGWVGLRRMDLDAQAWKIGLIVGVLMVPLWDIVSVTRILLADLGFAFVTRFPTNGDDTASLSIRLFDSPYVLPFVSIGVFLFLLSRELGRYSVDDRLRYIGLLRLGLTFAGLIVSGIITWWLLVVPSLRSVFA